MSTVGRLSAAPQVYPQPSDSLDISLPMYFDAINHTRTVTLFSTQFNRVRVGGGAIGRVGTFTEEAAPQAKDGRTGSKGLQVVVGHTHRVFPHGQLGVDTGTQGRQFRKYRLALAGS